MQPVVGQVLKGQKASYKILESLKHGSVFKAAVISDLSSSATCRVSPLAVIKAEPLEDREKIIYRREYDNQVDRPIASSPYIRSLQDCIGYDTKPSSAEQALPRRCMVLEWMDTDLWKARFHKIPPDSDLPRIVAKSILEALVVFQDLRATHTDINPNNVLLSGLDTPTPTVKVGDLGTLLMQGMDSMRLQGLEIRSPEVWKGQGCWPSSDVWSLGMLHWLATEPIFGATDKIIEGMTEAWCIAKIRRMIGPLGSPVKPEFDEESALADSLEKETYRYPPEDPKLRQFITRGPLRREIELRIPDGRASEECMDFIESLMVVDREERPTARQALEHPFITSV